MKAVIFQLTGLRGPTRFETPCCWWVILTRKKGMGVKLGKKVFFWVYISSTLYFIIELEVAHFVNQAWHKKITSILEPKTNFMEKHVDWVNRVSFQFYCQEVMWWGFVYTDHLITLILGYYKEKYFFNSLTHETTPWSSVNKHLYRVSCGPQEARKTTRERGTRNPYLFI